MSLIRSMEDLAQARTEALERQRASARQYRFDIRVGTASCGMASGAGDTLEAFKQWIASQDMAGVRLTEIGCMGLCALEPIVQVQETDRPMVIYGKVTPLIARRILQEHIAKGMIVQEYMVEDV